MKRLLTVRGLIGLIRGLFILITVTFLSSITTGCSPSATLPIPVSNLAESPEIIDLNPLDFEVIEIDAERAVVRISQGEFPLLTVEFRGIIGENTLEQMQIFVDQQAISLNSLFSYQTTAVNSNTDKQFQSQPQVAWIPIILLAWAAIDFISNCAIPVINDWNSIGTITENTAINCTIQAAGILASKIVSKLASSAIKVTALRAAIKNRVGDVVTWRQLQSLINKGTKPDIVAIIGKLTSMFYKGVVNALRQVFVEFGILHKPGVPPSISYITLEGKLLARRTNYDAEVYFSDEDGDVVSINFEQKLRSGWVNTGGWSFENQLGKYNGIIRFTTICNSTGTIIQRVTLKDIDGRSGSKEYSYSCTTTSF